MNIIMWVVSINQLNRVMPVPTLAAFPSSQPFPPLFPVYCTCPMISSASQQHLAGVHGEKEGGAGQFPKLVIQALSAALRGSHRVDACAKLAERLDPVSHRPRASRSRIWRWDQPINGPSLSVGCFEPRSTCGIPPLRRKDPFTHGARAPRHWADPRHPRAKVRAQVQMLSDHIVGPETIPGHS